MEPVRADVPQRIEEVLDRISDGFVAFDTAWRYTFVNKVAETYLGRPREALLGRALFEVFPTAAGTSVVRAYQRAVETGQPVEFELLSPVIGRWVSQKAYPTPGGLCVYFRDITEQKRRDNALRESEARYRSIFDHSPDGIFLTAPTGEIFDANPAGCRMFGRTFAEIRAAGRAGLIVENERLAALLEERRQRGHVRGEVDARRADGTLFPAEVSSTIFLDANGETRTSMVMRDLTVQKRAEAALRVLAEAGTVLIRSLDA
ncbi:MAG: PAS domain-containing protein, partial [Myxococcales bacterium]